MCHAACPARSNISLSSGISTQLIACRATLTILDMLTSVLCVHISDCLGAPAGSLPCGAPGGHSSDSGSAGQCDEGGAQGVWARCQPQGRAQGSQHWHGPQQGTGRAGLQGSCCEAVETAAQPYTHASAGGCWCALIAMCLLTL